MQIQKVVGLVLAGILTGAAGEAAAQSTNVAYAAPSTDYVVFLDSGAHLSPVAKDTVHSAAKAAVSARTVNIVGRRDYAEAVKGQLMRDGVPAQAIVMSPRGDDTALPAVRDGISDPASRRVEISF